MFNLNKTQGNANENNKIMCHTHQMGRNFCLVTPSISKDVEKQEIPFVAGGREKAILQ